MPRFERIVIDQSFPGGYQVEVADVNGDGKPDVIGVGGGTCAWFENPTWKKRIVTTSKQTPGIISSATADLDGDGKAEIAIAYEFAMNQPTKGKFLLASQGKSPDESWTLTPIADVGSIHRLRWGTFLDVTNPKGAPGSVSFDKRLALVVAPIFGPSARPPVFDQEPAHALFFFPGEQPKSGRWRQFAFGSAPVLHAIDVLDVDGDGVSDILGASNLGVSWFTAALAIVGAPVFHPRVVSPGAPGDAPKKGASEVHIGRLNDGHRFLATIEPWHGTEVAICLSESVEPLKFGPRSVIDSTLKDGHALWVADVDGDGDDEVFAGYRGKGTSVLAFDFNGKTWDRTVLDGAIAAQDLRGGDLDGDGTPDVVAIGGQSHNVAWYRPVKLDACEARTKATAALAEIRSAPQDGPDQLEPAQLGPGFRLSAFRGVLEGPDLVQVMTSLPEAVGLSLDLQQKCVVSDDHGVLDGEHPTIERHGERGDSKVPEWIEPLGVGACPEPGCYGHEGHTPKLEGECLPLVLLCLVVDPIGKLVNADDFLGPLAGREEVCVRDRVDRERRHGSHERDEHVNAPHRCVRSARFARSDQTEHEAHDEQRSNRYRHDTKVAEHGQTRRIWAASRFAGAGPAIAPARRAVALLCAEPRLSATCLNSQALSPLGFPVCYNRHDVSRIPVTTKCTRLKAGARA
jgi:hypothetical protein